MRGRAIAGSYRAAGPDASGGLAEFDAIKSAPEYFEPVHIAPSTKPSSTFTTAGWAVGRKKRLTLLQILTLSGHLTK